MAQEPFVGQLALFGGNFAPRHYALCNGQLLSIAQNTALFSILGTTYGGNGTTTFALPNFQARAPMHQGQGPGLTPRSLGESGGEEAITLLTTEMPAHNHQAGSAAAGSVGGPIGAVWGAEGRGRPPVYSNAGPNAPMSGQALAVAGGNLPHNNVQPYQSVTFIIALEGIFPARN
jgi:microcystin-dependent protein